MGDTMGIEPLSSHWQYDGTLAIIGQTGASAAITSTVQVECSAPPQMKARPRGALQGAQ